MTRFYPSRKLKSSTFGYRRFFKSGIHRAGPVLASLKMMGFRVFGLILACGKPKLNRAKNLWKNLEIVIPKPLLRVRNLFVLGFKRQRVFSSAGAVSEWHAGRFFRYARSLLYEDRMDGALRQGGNSRDAGKCFFATATGVKQCQD